MLNTIKNSHAAVRFVPLFAYLVIMLAEGRIGAASAYWVYALKVLVGGCLVAWVWPMIKEIRWTFNAPSVLTGIAVFAAWVGLDGTYPTLNEVFARMSSKPAAPSPDVEWNPFSLFAGSVFWGWFFVIVRIVGTTLVVPPLEEVFYRSLMYRAIASPDYEKWPLSHFSAKAFFITAVVFGVMHPEQWVAGVLCGLAYQALVLRCGHVGEAMAAHAVTNLLLGVWVVWKGAWKFW
ncbi:MAG: CAAX prenyl protease-related protein [Verrucomicrobia bacterium]|nr:CAAX prenyl protease-related protein [Verrucomicrobiota bacterium]